MLVRFACCVVLGAVLTTASLSPGAAQGNCSEQISKIMSRVTEKLTTRFNRVSKRIQKQGASRRLVAEECRIARQLKPRLENQLAALKQSGCIKDPQMGRMIADIVRGHEDDLATVRKTAAKSECH
jgi:hypothetical protein